ncbi:tyrosine transporter [Vibrio cyclitrophicus 1F175]|mgnify:FL=1|uniref:Tyrosine transporter n=3 Tax=Vibrio TaxID=662 RepID=A0A7Z1MG04_9VIBR|nr:Tyrosine-specific transport protein [Vibrio cyclitrophicus]KNH13621.1 tyrosine transporter [Vibrio lentus]OED65855.1 tyrosine transporter [Vibrio cyclitrophicus ZF99]OED80109.1 tyrosine transporter [Vibrio cyclitrophicus ZF65]OED92263.1 tyrosine transporter [Vibrio cyclitrophicus ZF30]OEE05095.1 tyrosine transporter [Vibrio cyclitrophicus ZF264]OEE06000.1 tyrosine transporter [Vibrio cyclitrophicus ZF28]OEE06617.1 tyrosine transporter [Vibrio cyclitrophicus ZF270]OEE15403.1 tyrosine tran|tara:strand:- start:1302 stop:2456 length:1155 start_codon:yes stop_codon:yes gene_type:complete
MNIKMIGSSLIIAGTALGAGMLAIPMVLAQFGLLYGTLLMVLICFGTTYAALLLLEATIKAGGGLGLNSIARKTLGRQGQLLTNGLLYALLICLLMAYILGAGDLLSKLLSNFGIEITATTSQIVFTLIAGAVVASGTGVIDKLNRALFFVMLASLFATMTFLAPSMTQENLMQVTSHDHVDLIKTSAILFTSFGFMVVIPTLVSYNHEATDKQLRNMVIVGSLIPLVCYLCWLFAVVGNLSEEQFRSFKNVSDLMAAFEAQSPWVGNILSTFTGLALLTSFFGVAMALFNQNKDMFNQNTAVTYCISFILPLVGSLLAADKFLQVLNYAGIILVFLAVFVPLVMVHKQRFMKVADDRYRAEGGNVMMLFSLLFGCFLLVSQVI